MSFIKQMLSVLSALLCISTIALANPFIATFNQFKNDYPDVAVDIEHHCPELITHYKHASYDSGWPIESLVFCTDGAMYGFVYGMTTGLLIKLFTENAQDIGIRYVLNKVLAGAQIGFLIGLLAQKQLFGQRIVPQDIKTGSSLALTQALITTTMGELLAATTILDNHISQEALRSASKKTSLLTAILIVITDTLMTKRTIVQQKVIVTDYLHGLMKVDALSEEKKHTLQRLTMLLACDDCA